MPDRVEIARRSRADHERIASEGALVRTAAPLRKRTIGKKRQLDVVARREPPEHRARVAPDAARIFGDYARVDCEAQRRHRAFFDLATFGLPVLLTSKRGLEPDGWVSR